MKNKFLIFFFSVVLGAWCLAPHAFAKPERLQIKTQDNKERHNQARNLAKTVDLSKIDDPEARKAFQAIFKTLNMQTKK